MKNFFYPAYPAQAAEEKYLKDNVYVNRISANQIKKTKKIRTKKVVILACTLLLFAIGINAAPVKPAQENYWVTETGPRSNPYTVIRLYDKADKQILEILMDGYRLQATKPCMIKRLNRLANAGHVNAIAISSILGIKASRISSVKMTNELHI